MSCIKNVILVLVLLVGLATKTSGALLPPVPNCSLIPSTFNLCRDIIRVGHLNGPPPAGCCSALRGLVQLKVVLGSRQTCQCVRQTLPIAPTPSPSTGSPKGSPSPSPSTGSPKGAPSPSPRVSPKGSPSPSPVVSPKGPPSPSPSTGSPKGAPSPSPSTGSPKGAPSPSPRVSPKGAPSPSPRVSPKGAPSPSPRASPKGAPSPSPTTGSPKGAPSPSPHTSPCIASPRSVLQATNVDIFDANEVVVDVSAQLQIACGVNLDFSLSGNADACA